MHDEHARQMNRGLTCATSARTSAGTSFGITPRSVTGRDLR